METITLKKLKDYTGFHFYANLSDLEKMGFELPSRGTPVMVKYFVLPYIPEFESLRFYKTEEGFDGVLVSPFASFVGKRNVNKEDVYVAVNPTNFQPIKFEMPQNNID